MGMTQNLESKHKDIIKDSVSELAKKKIVKDTKDHFEKKKLAKTRGKTPSFGSTIFNTESKHSSSEKNPKKLETESRLKRHNPLA